MKGISLTDDEQMLVLLYGDGTRQGLLDALTAMRSQLMPDETELEEMSASLVRKVSAMTDEDFKQAFPG